MFAMPAQLNEPETTFSIIIREVLARNFCVLLCLARIWRKQSKLDPIFTKTVFWIVGATRATKIVSVRDVIFVRIHVQPPPIGRARARLPQLCHFPYRFGAGSRTNSSKACILSPGGVKGPVFERFCTRSSRLHAQKVTKVGYTHPKKFRGPNHGFYNVFHSLLGTNFTRA